jgi:hypothetical protein
MKLKKWDVKRIVNDLHHWAHHEGVGIVERRDA